MIGITTRTQGLPIITSTLYHFNKTDQFRPPQREE